MAFPAGWPPRPAGNTRSIRFFKSGNATVNFSDNAYLFIDGVSADTFTKTPVVAPGDLTPVAFGDGTKSGGPAGGSNNLDPATKPMLWANTIVVYNDSGADLEISFDGVNIHDKILAAEPTQWHLYRNRHEAGIAIKGNGAFRIAAW
jgi:hypothetical protein